MCMISLKTTFMNIDLHVQRYNSNPLLAIGNDALGQSLDVRFEKQL